MMYIMHGDNLSIQMFQNQDINSCSAQYIAKFMLLLLKMVKSLEVERKIYEANVKYSC